MNRRKLLAGVGISVSGAAGVLSTGAFTSVGVERQVAFAVTNDANAYLGLDPDSDSFHNSEYATEQADGTVRIDLTGDSSGDFNGTGASPFAQTVIEEVIKVTNQGAQKVLIFGTSGELEVNDDFELFLTDPENESAGRTDLLKSPSSESPDGLRVIGPGESLALGFELDGRDLDNSELNDLEELVTDLQVVIHADAEEVP